ncbi:MAG: hypothetical protein MZV70_29015 [Desulfobacterales bacterium]|nr:hypothetical protein [Desulfobacterales bacterium]
MAPATAAMGPTPAAAAGRDHIAARSSGAGPGQRPGCERAAETPGAAGCRPRDIPGAPGPSSRVSMRSSRDRA